MDCKELKARIEELEIELKTLESSVIRMADSINRINKKTAKKINLTQKVLQNDNILLRAIFDTRKPPLKDYNLVLQMFPIQALSRSQRKLKINDIAHRSNVYHSYTYKY
jgi:hypothetical protein